MEKKDSPEYKAKRRRWIIADSVLAVLNILALLLLFLLLHRTYSPIGEDGTKSLSLNIEKYVHVGVDTISGNRCDITMLNEQSGDVVFFDKGTTNGVRAIHFVSNTNKHFLSAYFNNEGLVEYICSENISAVFNDYKETSVDIAIVRGNNFKLLNDYDTGKQWRDCLVDSVVNQGKTQEELYYYDRLPLLQTRLNVVDMLLSVLSSIGYPEVGNDANWAKNMMQTASVSTHTSIEKFFYNFDTAGSPTQFLKYDKGLDRDDIIYQNLNTSLTECHEWLPFYKWWFDFFDKMYNDHGTDRTLGKGAIETGQGALKVTLAWPFYADIDLHAVEPNGNEIFFSNSRSNISDGYLDHDDTTGGGAIENIFWQHPRPGHYRVYLHYYGTGQHDGSHGGNCKVTIIKNGEGTVYTVPMHSVGDRNVVAEFDL